MVGKQAKASFNLAYTKNKSYIRLKKIICIVPIKY